MDIFNNLNLHPPPFTQPFTATVLVLIAVWVISLFFLLFTVLLITRRDWSGKMSLRLNTTVLSTLIAASSVWLSGALVGAGFPMWGIVTILVGLIVAYLFNGVLGDR